MIIKPHWQTWETRMDDYARTLEYTGEANRAIGNERAASEQFSKARDLYRKLGYSPSNPAVPRVACAR
jgi:hypothetical protein